MDVPGGEGVGWQSLFVMGQVSGYTMSQPSFMEFVTIPLFQIRKTKGHTGPISDQSHKAHQWALQAGFALRSAPKVYSQPFWALFSQSVWPSWRCREPALSFL